LFLPFLVDSLIAQPDSFLANTADWYIGLIGDVPAPLLAYMGILIIVGLVMALYGRRKEQKALQSFLDQDDETTRGYAPSVTQPIIYPITAKQPFSPKVMLVMIIFCSFWPAFLRFTFWSPQFHHDPSDLRIDVIGDILAVALFVISIWLVWEVGFNIAYTADTQGLTFRRGWRTRTICWQDVRVLQYIPFQRRNPHFIESYVIRTQHDLIMLDVPTKAITYPENNFQRALLEYQENLRKIAVIAATESGIPIRVSKELEAQRERYVEYYKRSKEGLPILLFWPGLFLFMVGFGGMVDNSEPYNSTNVIVFGGVAVIGIGMIVWGGRLWWLQKRKKTTT